VRAAGAMLAVGSAVVLDACGKSDSTRVPLRKSTPQARAADASILNHMLGLEYATITAYIAGMPLLSADEQKVLQHFVLQEMTHAGELQGLVKEAHANPVKQQYSYELGHPRTGTEALLLLQAQESALIRGYLTAIPRLSPGPVRAAVASMAANDAQHLSMVRSALGRPLVPSAFVTGSD
jgi:hypothetical protein